MPMMSNRLVVAKHAIRMLASFQRYRAATSVAPGPNGRTLSGSCSVAHAGGLGPRSEGRHDAFRSRLRTVSPGILTCPVRPLVAWRWQGPILRGDGGPARRIACATWPNVSCELETRAINEETA